MKSIVLVRRILFLAMILLLASIFLNFHSCDDPFGCTVKHIKYSYYLEDFCGCGDMFNLIKKEKIIGDYVNVFDGCVRKINIDDNHVYAEIQKCYRGDKDGIYVLNMKNGEIYGPLDKIPEGIKLVEVEKYYDEL